MIPCLDIMNVGVEAGKDEGQVIIFPVAGAVSFPGAGQVVFPTEIGLSSGDQRICLPHMNVGIEPGFDMDEQNKRVCLSYMNVGIEAGESAGQIIIFPVAGAVSFPGAGQITFP